MRKNSIPKPMNRTEAFLSSMLGELYGSPLSNIEPISREEYYLKLICQKVSQGGASTEELKLIIKELADNGEISAYDDAEIRNVIGTLNNLTTTDKTSLVDAINEVFTSVSNGKSLIASAITDKGVTTSNDATFQTMANNISSITTSGSGSGSETTTKDPYRTDRVLIWEDDFNGTSLNTDVWNYATGYIANNESQYYTTDSKNVYLENSNLVLKAIREDVQGYMGTTPQTFNWTSGKIESSRKKEFQYGRIEAKIKIPQTVGSFPAFWTLGNTHEYTYGDQGNREDLGEPWAYCGEIDIMEHKQGKTQITSGGIYNTGSGVTDVGRKGSDTIDFTKYNIYSIEWTKDKITFYVNDTAFSYFTVTDDMTMFRMPHYLQLNHAIGASGGTPPDDVNEYEMLVDWVRVYAPKDVQTNSISLNKTSTSVTVGDADLLKVNYGSSYTSDRGVKWTSSNNSIAEVHAGRVWGKSAGTATITATCGTYTATCSVTVSAGTITTYTVTNNLTNASNNNSSTTVNENSSYNATISPATGYTLSSITVTMGGTDITSSSVSNGNISITSVTGDIVITASATATSSGGGDTDTIKSRAIYSMTTPTTFDGTSGINTGVKLFDEDGKAFSIMIDYTGTTETISGSENQLYRYLMCCMNGIAPYPGFYVATSTTIGQKLTLVGSGNGNKVETDFNRYEADNRKLIVYREQNGAPLYISYMYNGSLVTKNIADYNKAIMDDTLSIGSGIDGDGNFFRGWLGSINSCYVWFETLSQDDITTLLS